MRATGMCASALSAVVLLLAGCSGSDSDDAPSPTAAGSPASSSTPSTATSDSPAPNTTASPAPPAAGEPTFPTGPDTQSSAAGESSALVLTGVQVVEQPQFTRLTLTFSGTGLAGWNLNYVPSATASGSGQPIVIDGDATLDVTITGVSDISGYTGPNRIDPDDGDIDDVVIDGVAGGNLHIVLGVDGPNAGAPYRAFIPTGTTNVVIDVQDVED